MLASTQDERVEPLQGLAAADAVLGKVEVGRPDVGDVEVAVDETGVEAFLGPLRRGDVVPILKEEGLCVQEM